MQTVGVTATNEAKSIGSLPDDRSIGPTLAQTQPDGPTSSQIGCFVVSCTQHLAKGYMRALSQHLQHSGKHHRARPHAREGAGGSSFPKKLPSDRWGAKTGRVHRAPVSLTRFTFRFLRASIFLGRLKTSKA